MPPDHFRALVIVNPASAGGATGRKWARHEAALRASLGGFQIAFSRGPGDATALCRQALADAFEMIVAVGGDGTCNEVLGGFFDGARPTAPGAVLGIVPLGTGRDLARTLEIAPESACARLQGRAVRRVDVGLARFP